MKQKNYFIIQLFLILITLFVGYYYFQKHDMLIARIALRFFYISVILRLLYIQIGPEGYKFFRLLIISIILDTAVVPFFYLSEKNIAPVIGAYLFLVPIFFLFFQIYNFDSSRYDKIIKNQFLIFFILFTVFAICYFVFIDSIETIAIIAVILNLVLVSIILGLTFFLKMNVLPKALYITGAFSLLFSLIIAIYYYFIPRSNTNINISVHLKIIGYFSFILAMYFQNKTRLKSIE